MYGMVNVQEKRCSHGTCARRAYFNVEGNKTRAYCQEHAKDGMVNVRRKTCANATCSVQPTFNVEGNKSAVYCRKHAEDGMVNVCTRRCSHDSCNKKPSWGVLADGVGTACAEHKGNVVDSPMINMRAPCKVVGCRKRSTWGMSEKQPSHCRDHGPLEDGLVPTLTTNRANGALPRSISRDQTRLPSHVKAECYF